MKKMIVGIVLAGSVMTSPLATADRQTVSLGYAHSKIQDMGNLNGVNLQYRYEWNSPLSIIGSFSYMKGDDSDVYHDAANDSYKTRFKTKYYSLLAGPAYRINDYVSVYGLLGAAFTKTDGRYEWRNSVGADAAVGHLTIEGSAHSTNLAWAAGVAINPIDNLSVNIGYEGSRTELNGSDKSINGFNVGIGWRF
ncbi:Ail/Lom family outer membrane beta-barrel protein [Erwinia pyri]|uniref:Ail/Lom family outer membrane beta-barrel protein n=1 Tax=Erwinia pyri TaxID=3062598 RepID=A0AA50DL70_9GAMM|nr:Ail/Lom family outer membrane beta-barrel protein [Erwinia sp. DE2]WLS79984.1 Ail/Lom family outer membrane beta-barrel protein [Erwinia sp. DE2]